MYFWWIFVAFYEIYENCQFLAKIHGLCQIWGSGTHKNYIFLMIFWPSRVLREGSKSVWLKSVFFMFFTRETEFRQCQKIENNRNRPFLVIFSMSAAPIYVIFGFWGHFGRVTNPKTDPIYSDGTFCHFWGFCCFSRSPENH